MKGKLMLCVVLAAVTFVSTPKAYSQEVKQVKPLDIGQTAFDVGGKRFTVVSVRDNNTWRHDQSTMYAIESNAIEYYTTQGKTRTRIAEPKLLTHDTASSPGTGKLAISGFITNLPNAGGLIGLGALLRPSNINQSNNGGNQSQSQGPVTQNQVQAQSAQGGAGGAGGSSSINTGGGGIGGTTITANGGANVNTGNVGIGGINQQ